MTVVVAAKTETFTNGTANDAVPVNSEFAATFNNDSLLAAEINSVANSAFTFSGTKTFNDLMRWSQASITVASDAITPTKIVHYLNTEAAAATDNLETITPNGAGQILFLRGADASKVVTLKHGTGNVYLLDNTDYVFSDTENYIALFYDSSAARWNELFRTNPNAIKAKRYFGGPAPTYSTAAAIILPTSLQAFDSTSTYLLQIASNQTVSLASSGANGLDTGAEASNTWYYVYLIGDSTGVNVPKGLFSVTNEVVSGSVTLPSGYNLKRQLPLAVRNDASSNIVPFFQAGMGGLVRYDGETSRTSSAGTVTAAAAPYNLLTSGTAAAFTAVSASSMVPPISRMARVAFHAGTSADFYGRVRPTGSSATVGTCIDCSILSIAVMDIPLNASQQFDYIRTFSTGTLHSDIMGWFPTEIF